MNVQLFNILNNAYDYYEKDEILAKKIHDLKNKRYFVSFKTFAKLMSEPYYRFKWKPLKFKHSLYSLYEEHETFGCAIALFVSIIRIFRFVINIILNIVRNTYNYVKYHIDKANFDYKAYAEVEKKAEEEKAQNIKKRDEELAQAEKERVALKQQYIQYIKYIPEGYRNKKAVDGIRHYVKTNQAQTMEEARKMWQADVVEMYESSERAENERYLAQERAKERAEENLRKAKAQARAEERHRELVGAVRSVQESEEKIARELEYLRNRK